jgi:ketosteroid isomerase-like protein
MRLSKSTLGIVLLPLALASCGGEPEAEAAPPPEPMSAAGANAIRDAYAMSFMGKNAPAIAAFYAENATMIGADGAVVTGRAAIQEALQQQFAAGFDSLAITSTSFQATGDQAVDQGTYVIRQLDPKTKEATRFTGSYVVTIMRQPDGSFQIVKDSAFAQTEIK